ncbi:MAG TPA: CBS domain-containing protein [Gaiellaceae bacterium]|nr:CBS domain-containing protein [Gaiellaceae bacterium]
MNVGDVMKRELLTAEAATPLQVAAERMCDRNVGAILVLNGDAISGILTERDVLRAVAQGRVEGTNVAAWMTRDPETVTVEDAGRDAAATMLRGGFRHLPVLDDGRPVGIVSIRDLMGLVVEG